MNAQIHLLKNKNLTVTPQRLEIVQLLTEYGHLNIDDLYRLLQNKFPSLSLATVYKNINTMLAKLFLSEVKLANRKNVYELIKEDHSHMVCLKCQEIVDIKLNLSCLYEEVTAKSEYKLESSSLTFNGICEKCQ